MKGRKCSIAPLLLYFSIHWLLMYLYPPANEPAFEIRLIVIKSFKEALERFKKKSQDLRVTHIRDNQKPLLKGWVSPAIKFF